MLQSRADSITKHISALRSKTEAPPAGINAGQEESMKEFAFEKEYDLCSQPSTMKRLANRIGKAYIEVTGHYSEFLDEHLSAIAKMEETELELEDTFVITNEHKGHCVYDRIKTDYEYRIQAMMSTNEYGEAVYYVKVYFYDNETYFKWTGRKELKAKSFEDMQKQLYECGKYRYWACHRPPSECVLPSDYVYFEYYGLTQYPLGEARFDRELTTEECAKYGLKLDKGWEHERAVFFEIEKERI